MFIKNMAPFCGKGFWLCLLMACGALAVEREDFPLADQSAVDRNTCAMTQVLLSMNDLLTVLSDEVRDLKKQIQTNCKGKDRGGRPVTRPEGGAEEEEEELDEDYEVFKNFGDPEPEDDGDDYNEDDYGDKTPAEDLLGGVFDWFNSPFAEPTTTTTTTTTTTSTTEEPFASIPGSDDSREDPYGGDDDRRDGDDDRRGKEDRYGGYDDRYKPDPIPTTVPVTVPTTATPLIPFTIPPEPTSCKSPFRLQAGGCYLVFHDIRDWKSWGEANSFCQNYGGALAAPWRMQELQEFLLRYYSDAFWIGARFDEPTRSWKWQSGRAVESSIWKPGQPARNPGMKCVFLDKWSGYHANNFFCGEKYPFICEYREKGI